MIIPAPSGKDSEHCAGTKLMGPRHQHRPGTGHCAGASGTISHSHPASHVSSTAACPCASVVRHRRGECPAHPQTHTEGDVCSPSGGAAYAWLSEQARERATYVLLQRQAPSNQ